MRASNGLADPRSASIDIAAATSTASASPHGVAPRQRERGRGWLRAVDQREPFLRVEPDRRQPGLAQRAVERLAFADEHQRQMRERREVAAGAHRATRRDARMHARV